MHVQRVHQATSRGCTASLARSSAYRSAERRKKRRLEAQLKTKASESHIPNPSEYILTVEQMIENEYPIPSSLFQCTTEDGQELTRVCMIDYDTQLVVYDRLVKPAKPVIDYLTRWSGITAEALATATTTLSEAQAHVLRLLNPVSFTPKPNPFSTQKSTSASPSSPPLSPILLGHSLESDLKALKIAHSFCVDTALIYSHPIHIRGEGGHDPEEDARATMELVRKKVENGREFGEFKADMEGLFERIGRAVKRSSWAAGTGGEKIRTAVIDHGNPGMMHESKASTCLGCKDDEEVVKNFVDVVESDDFVLVRLMGLAGVLGKV
ncbi:hypothetical protein BDP27DRAFT_1422812 [Rhodocollybia butyracea]|uniref:Exonuclease domain-containing protein n=1 Tax=Rhodocollybia butyracea TaxID=206335 RepID=A0A9P5PKX4_9AGAR|nr:hypothetical protein BDP27DRAFT_1422812 [Rhodocollybia butyracea]